MRKESPSNDSTEAVEELKEIMQTASQAVQAGDVFEGTMTAEPVVDFLAPIMHVENPCIPPEQIMFLVHDLSWVATDKPNNSLLGEVPPDDRKSVRYVNMSILPDEVKAVVSSVLALMKGSYVPDLPGACVRLAARVNEINGFQRAAEEQKARTKKEVDEHLEAIKKKYLK